MRVDGGQQIGAALDIGVVEIGLGAAPDRPCGVDNRGTAGHQLPQRLGPVQVALDELYTLGGEVAGLLQGAGQGPELKSLPQQFGTQRIADKPRCPR